MIADHIRAIAFSIADGQLPSNTGAGYVIRRILRRAVRYGYSFLDLKEPFLYQLIDPLIKVLGEFFPELQRNRELIEKVIREEEQSFLRTLAKGIAILENVEGNNLSGEFAFELYDTYGFPIDLTRLIAAEKGLKVDMPAFEAELQKQKDRSRKATAVDSADWKVLKPGMTTEFIGYDQLEAEVQIVQYREVDKKGKREYELVLDQTPFYPEGGGQVGDQGWLKNEEEEIFIKGCRKENNLILHLTDQLPKEISANFQAGVSAERAATILNHTATHLLHFALRQILGDHVEQKGSLVHPDYLRFDFSHFQKVGEEELQQIEGRVNQLIRANQPLEEHRELPMAEAKAAGAMALFGEKYGEKVRMIKFGDSVELCGGTHAPATGNLGLFKITSESAVAAGIRRIEAVSGVAAEKLVRKQQELLEQLKERLKQPKDLLQAVEKLQTEQQELNRQVEAYEKQAVKQAFEQLKAKIQQKNDCRVLIEEVNLKPVQIKDLLFRLKSTEDRLFAVLGSRAEQKPTLSVLISESLVEEKAWHAGQVVKELARHIQGGGGGQAFFATAGGKKAEGIPAALAEALNQIELKG